MKSNSHNEKTTELPTDSIPIISHTNVMSSMPMDSASSPNARNTLAPTTFTRMKQTLTRRKAGNFTALVYRETPMSQWASRLSERFSSSKRMAPAGPAVGG